MFKSGDEFPGGLHRARIARYSQYRNLLKGLYNAAIGVEAVLATFGQDYLQQIRQAKLAELLDEVKVVANLPKTIAKRLAGMTIAGISITSENQKASQAIADSLAASKWPRRRRTIGYRSLTYGNAILTCRRDADGAVFVDARDPWTWFPEIDPYNPANAMAHVFAWSVRRGENEAYLLQERHGDGRIVRTAHELVAISGSPLADGPIVDARVGAQAPWAMVVGPGLSEEEPVDSTVPLVAVVQSWTDDESIFGESIIAGNESLIAEATNRLSRIAMILDKHASPKLQGPEGARRRDQDGRPTFEIRDDYFPLRSGEEPFQYITWESQLEHAHQELDRVLGLLCLQMDMSPDLIGLNLQKGAGVEATDTLRIRSFSTLAAIDDQRDFMRDGLRDMARGILSLAGESPDVPINIAFGDPLPLSTAETADLIQAERMAGVVSRETAVRRLNPDASDPEIVAELKRIGDEEMAAFNPGQE